MSPLAAGLITLGLVGLLCGIVCMISDSPPLRLWREVIERDGEPWFKGTDPEFAIHVVESLDYEWAEHYDYAERLWVIAVYDQTIGNLDEPPVTMFLDPDLDVARRWALGWFWHEGNSKARN